jgi:hypothetical protein
MERAASTRMPEGRIVCARNARSSRWVPVINRPAISIKWRPFRDLYHPRAQIAARITKKHQPTVIAIAPTSKPVVNKRSLISFLAPDGHAIRADANLRQLLRVFQRPDDNPSLLVRRALSLACSALSSLWSGQNRCQATPERSAAPIASGSCHATHTTPAIRQGPLCVKRRVSARVHTQPRC